MDDIRTNSSKRYLIFIFIRVGSFLPMFYFQLLVVTGAWRFFPALLWQYRNREIVEGDYTYLDKIAQPSVATPIKPFILRDTIKL